MGAVHGSVIIGYTVHILETGGEPCRTNSNSSNCLYFSNKPLLPFVLTLA